MKIFNELWNRVGLITKLTKELADTGTQLGKTAMMKYMYILQEVFDVPLGYRFSLYTYGPYCSDVLSDLDYTEVLGGVRICPVDAGMGGYSIRPTDGTDEYIKKSESFLSENEESINTVIKLFGGMTARELELRSTIIYLYKTYLQNDWKIGKDEIAENVQELKPYFSIGEIRKAYDELKKMRIFERIVQR